MTLAWNWKKDTAPAACIRSKHIVSADEMAEVLCWWYVDYDESHLADSMTAAEIEAIVRRVYRQYGLSWVDDNWRGEVSESEAADLIAWARGLVAGAWPTRVRPVTS